MATLAACGGDDGAVAFRFTALERGADGEVVATGSEGRTKVQVRHLVGAPDPDEAMVTVHFDVGHEVVTTMTVECLGMQDGACVFVVRTAEGAEARVQVSPGDRREVFPGDGRHGVRLTVD